MKKADILIALFTFTVTIFLFYMEALLHFNCGIKANGDNIKNNDNVNDNVNDYKLIKTVTATVNGEIKQHTILDLKFIKLHIPDWNENKEIISILVIFSVLNTLFSNIGVKYIKKKLNNH